MKITKLGHCCLLIETKGKRILTDPGNYTIEAQTKLEDIDFVLFTHEHADHFHVESLRVILEKNPQAAVYANSSVSELLNAAGIAHALVSHNESLFLGDVSLLGFGEKHAAFHSSLPLAANIGYMIDDKLWYPGDAFTNPEREIEILALPVAGPWMKIGEAIDYALLLKPKVAFPVHDHLRLPSQHMLPEKVLTPAGIRFIPMVEGDSREF